MINYKLSIICSYSILLAVIIGLVRFRNISRAYQPFIFVTIAALLNEMMSTLLIYCKISNAVSVNILNIVESYLWLWQFKRWGILTNGPKWVMPLIALSFGIIWVTENIIMGKIFIFSSVFSIVASFILVFMAISQVNKLIVQERNNLLKNAKFLICSGVLIFHTYRILIESFYLMKLDNNDGFLLNIFFILVFVNLFVNLLYAFAMLWIPTRQRFTMQY